MYRIPDFTDQQRQNEIKQKRIMYIYHWKSSRGKGREVSDYVCLDILSYDILASHFAQLVHI